MVFQTSVRSKLVFMTHYVFILRGNYPSKHILTTFVILVGFCVGRVIFSFRLRVTTCNYYNSNNALCVHFIISNHFVVFLHQLYASFQDLIRITFILFFSILFKKNASHIKDFKDFVPIDTKC